MTGRKESVLILIVGLIAGISGAYALLFSNYGEMSGWRILWDAVRLIAGTVAIVAAVKGLKEESAE